MRGILSSVRLVGAFFVAAFLISGAGTISAAVPDAHSLNAQIQRQVEDTHPAEAGAGAGAGAGQNAGSGAGASAGEGAGTNLSGLDDDSGHNSGGPACGTVRFTKYECKEGVTVTREANGPSEKGDHEVPKGCVREQGAKFGSIHQADKSEGDTDGPFPGKDDATAFTFLGYTNLLGRLTVTDITDVMGRYVFAELASDTTPVPDEKVIGFFCTGGDSGDGSDNYAFSYLTLNTTEYCVVYNGVDIPTPGDDDDDSAGDDDDDNGGGNGDDDDNGGGNGGNGGGGPCINCGGGNGDDDDDNGGGNGDDDDDNGNPNPDITVTPEIAGALDLPGVPQTGGGGNALIVFWWMLASISAIALGRFAWKR